MSISSVVSRRSRLLHVPHFHWLLQSFCLLFCSVPWGQCGGGGQVGGGDWWRNSVWGWVFQGVSLFVPLFSCWSLYVFPSTAGEADTSNLLCSVFIMDFTKVFCLVTNTSHIYDSLKMSALVTVLWKTTAAACPFCHLSLNLIWYIDYLLLILILIG